ncbi:hypothetical protein SBV1_1890018 [Verrucomicrobia bacterium]|nr:hypothetical protein SBV1_1890018 [Verrucomicrobiota bacterium]
MNTKTTKYLSVEEAAKRGSKGEFFQNVGEAVIPRLIENGLLHGKKEKDRQLVADDEALARVMKLGVESFVYNQQGYSFMAVRTPIDQVAAKLKARPGVAQYEESVKPLRMVKGAEVQPDEKVRHTFLVQMRDSPEWSVLIQTVHWFHSCDSVMGTALACALSKEFQTLAAAAWDDDFSGSSLIVCEKGNQQAAISDEGEEDGWEGFYEFFYEQGIYLPELFIATSKGTPILYAADPAKVQRADYVVLKVPREVESQGPHVVEKVGMMAEAIAEGLDDEEAFMGHMREGIWRQAQAILAAGEF